MRPLADRRSVPEGAVRAPWTRGLARTCALAAAAVVGIVVAAAPAAAHVTISPTEGEAGAFTVLTVSVPHGCDGSPTTKIAVQMPDQILSVTPTRNPLWDVEKVTEQLDEPVADAHGNEVTERVARVVYTAHKPLPDGYRDTFELSLQLPDAAGETLAFPVIQTCAEGETAWTQVATDGNEEDLEAPAPTVTILPAGEGSEGDDGSDALDVVALVAGLLGLAAGAGALVLVRRRT